MTPSGKTHVIFGTGPSSCWTARALRARGLAVRAVNRSGQRPALMPADVPVMAADALDARQAQNAARGAAVVYQALGPAYDRWAEWFPTLQRNTVAAAQGAGARYVALENLYMLDADTPMTEASSAKPRSAKGIVRSRMHDELMALHASGELQVASVRSSCFYGPGVTESSLGKRVFAQLLAGKKAQMVGRIDVPHSFAFIEDVGRTLATVGSSADPVLWGKTWLAPHAKAQTQGDWLDAACAMLGQPARAMIVGPWLMRMAGMFDSDAKASVEMLYQFVSAFQVDSSRSEHVLDLKPTPMAEGLRRTLDWYRQQAE